MNIKTNKSTLLKQALVGKIAPPIIYVNGGFLGGYVITWDGKPKLGIGVGGIKYNVKVGDPCFGWPEAEFLEPGVTFMGIDEKADPTAYNFSATGMAFSKYSCIGNTVTMIDGEGKNAEGFITGKGGSGGTRKHISAHFKQEDLEKLSIGDKARVTSYGVGLEIDGFDGKIYNMSPEFLESLNLEINEDKLVIPVVKEIPYIAMGIGVGGSPAEMGTWCVQTSPPHLVKKLGLKDLKIGDLVLCHDVLTEYGKGFYRGAVTVGVLANGASEVAGNGPGMVTLFTSKNGKIEPRLEPDSNISKYLKLED